MGISRIRSLRLTCAKMGVERVFLGWESACLPKAADVLCGRWGREGGADFSNVLIVTPGSRAGRRLLEILAQLCRGPWLPPRMLTPGSLAEQLYQPSEPLASGVQSQMAWLRALQSAPELVQKLTPHPPDADDVAAWFGLAGEVRRMLSELASQGLRPGTVAERGERLPDFCDQQRWLALERLSESYRASLAARGLADADHSLAEAVAQKTIRSAATIVLLAVTELPAVLKQALRLAASKLLVLVHAPQEEAGGFDDLGCLVPEYWAKRHSPVQLPMLRVADRPCDQAEQVLLALSGIDHLDPSPSTIEAVCIQPPDSVTVGLADSQLAAAIQRTLELAGVPARAATGRPIRLTRPVLLLEALAQFLSSGRFDDFANLLRHPDIPPWLARTEADHGVETWLTLLDRYATDHLGGRSAQQWLGEPATAERLKRAWDAVASLVDGNPQIPRPLQDWAPQIARVLVKIYGDLTLTRSRADHEPLIQSLEAIGQAIRELTAVSSPADPPLSLPQVMQLVVAAVSDSRLTPTGGPPAVELLGWLELHLDDAPTLIVTGFNEGNVPASAPRTALLPDRLRQVLGLEDHARRYARDLYWLTAIIHSRKTTLIMGRHGAQDEPLAPSRLVLACDEEELARRVAWFYGVEKRTRPATSIMLLDIAERSELLIPPPQAPRTPLTELAVTAFRDYLACPYRFYLKHVLRLRELDDAAVQMEASLFGTLAHEVLQQFACRGPEGSVKAEEIGAFLEAELEAAFERRFGPGAPVAAMLQREQLRQRLRAFARWQANHAAEGWHILPQDAERTIKAALDVDGEEFTISGRIDRIDRHPEHGYALLDYKTGSRSPEQAHRRGPRHEKQWIDLQLPLYRLLAREIKIENEPTLGFILLPTDTKKTGLKPAQWTPSELDTALEMAKFVVRRIRAGVFWPPGEPVDDREDDGLAGVCLDRCLQREEVIKRMDAQLARGAQP